MVFVRSIKALPRSAPRAALAGRVAPFSSRTSLYATPNSGGSSYGGGEGDPKGENPQQQGAQKSSDLEHPGPPPPDVGKGTGGGPTKATEKGHEGPGAGKESENSMPSSSSSSSSSSGSGSGSSSGGASPKVHNPSQEAADSEDVKRHNEEFARRHDRPSEGAGEAEKVDGKFWGGHGGADRNP